MHSLASRHPWRLDVPLLLSASLVLLAEGLTMPALQITAFIFWRSEFSILENIQRLYEGDRRPAGIVLETFEDVLRVCLQEDHGANPLQQFQVAFRGQDSPAGGEYIVVEAHQALQ